MVGETLWGNFTPCNTK